ncbi:MAG: ArsC/Spx/MgsR family protein [Pseudomonadota bacterium]
MTLKIYGYAGCTTVKKARDWATANSIDHDYQHFSKTVDLRAQIDSWVAIAGIDRVFNDKAQTLKKMDDAERLKIIASTDSKLQAMANDPRLIKRPIGTNGTTVLSGFNPDEWGSAFN